ncbi:MAG TPA: hypothetical protein VJW75_01265 [Candidatus Eisenbacteria bacterium]|nr:hypothetical protein [Candidatus Eisenbacteria bacterium]
MIPSFSRLATALAVLAALAFSLVAAPADALPLYASREGATCATCHVDPNGGGMRNDFGFVYLKNRHALEAEERFAKVTVDPRLNEWIAVGLDTRILYVASHSNGGPTLTSSTFFPMQGQVNVAVTPHEHLTLVASHGITVDDPGFPTGYVARELYGMLEGLPGRTYARVGRFRLPFGLRQDDHTSYVRSLAFLPYDSQKDDAGIEVGAIGSRWFGQVSFTNGTTPFDERAQTIAAKVGRAVSAFQAGLSGFHRYAEDLDVKHDRWALYGSATKGPFTALGEYARGTDDFPVGVATNLEAFFAEADYRALRGLNVRGKFDWVNPDRAAGALIERRYTLEMDLNPVPFTEIKLSGRYYDRPGGVIDKEFLAMFYFPF